jgi:N-hydroxyarylamine O-acetyltransferase
MKDAHCPTIYGASDVFLSNDLLNRVKNALELPEIIPADTAGLRLLYAAWCEKVPFDNIRKMISLRSGTCVPLAGLDAEDFFENWLENGSGGTCWPSSNALYVLLRLLGFDARRVAASMFDIGIINHGTIKVNLDGHDWMLDTSMLTNEPLPLNGGVYIGNPPVGVEVEPLTDTYMVWIDFVPLPKFVPCRLHIDPVDTPFYHERYEIFSREQSPFNQRLYMRTSGSPGPSVLYGNTKFSRTADGAVVIREFTPDQLCAYLTDEAGISPALVERWAASGSLESTFDPANAGSAPEVIGVRPSLRNAAMN